MPPRLGPLLLRRSFCWTARLRVNLRHEQVRSRIVRAQLRCFFKISQRIIILLRFMTLCRQAERCSVKKLGRRWVLRIELLRPVKRLVSVASPLA